MDAKEIKSLLKSAREAVRNKEYKDALKHCKAILKHDKSNYNALVFVGVAAEGLEQPEQAIMAYKKASQIDPSQLLAWQGMCSFYEKNNKDEDYEAMTDVYEQLMKLHDNDIVKISEILCKLCRLFENHGDHDSAIKYLRNAVEKVKDVEFNINKWKEIIRIVQSKSEKTDDDNDTLYDGYKFLIENNTNFEDDFSLRKDFIDLLKCKMPINIQQLEEEYIKLINKYPENAYVLVNKAAMWFDKHFLETSRINKEELDDNIKSLQKLNEEAVILDFLIALQQFVNGLVKDAEVTIASGFSKDSKNVAAWTLYAQINAVLHKDIMTGKAASFGIKLIEKNETVFYGDKQSVLKANKLALASSLLQQGSSDTIQKAFDIVKDEDDSGMKKIYIECLLALKHYDEANQAIKDTSFEHQYEEDALQGWLAYLIGDLDQALSCLEKSCEVDTNNSVSLHRLGVVYWSKAKTDQMYAAKAFDTFLKSAKSDPNVSKNFMYIGFYYRDILGDKVKASKCLSKSFELEKHDEECGTALVDLLADLDQSERSLEILREVTGKASAGSCKWAWLRYGLVLLKQGELTQAIGALQSALRADPTDEHCWECLGEAYMKRGSYTAAMKAFSKTIELNPEAFYSRYQLAAIMQTVGTYTEAVTAYEDVLKQNSDYVPALCGIGETYLLLAKTSLKDFFHGRALGYCQKSSEYLTRAVRKRHDMGCIWKLLGDVFTLVNEMPDELVTMQVNGVLISENNVPMQEMHMIELLSLGSRCYGMGLKLNPKSAALWKDLGVNYWHQSRKTKDSNASISVLAQSIQCLQKSISLDKNNYHNWLILGTICSMNSNAENAAFAQHCLIKSIELEPNNVQAWTHLGVLYMKKGNIQLANESFKMAQSLEPNHVECWLGQAMLAETVGQQEESMDLFRHATELSNHTEGSIGYGHWVCSILKDKEKLKMDWNSYVIHQMAAVPAACDAMHRFTEREKTNATAYNIYGLLLERQKLYQTAAAALSKALRLLRETSDVDILMQVRSNYARCLFKCERYQDSVSEYMKLGQKMSFSDLCGLALCLYKNKQYEEAKKIYNQALTLAQNEADKSNVNAAIGMAAYAMGDLDDARTALFLCSQSSEPSADGLVCLCALGLLQNDLTLTGAVLAELHDEFPSLVQRFTAEVFFRQGQSQEALAVWEKGLEDGVLSPLDYVVFILQNVPLQADKLLAFLPTLSSMNAKHIAIGSLAAGENIKSIKSAFSAAQKAVHLNPSCSENWTTLLTCSQSMLIFHQSLKFVDTLLPFYSHIMSALEKQLSASEGKEKDYLQKLHQCCAQHYVIALLQAERSQQAQHFLHQALWLYDDDEFLLSLQAYISQSFSDLRKNVGVSSFRWNMLANLYASHKLIPEGIEMFREWQRKDGCRDVACVHMVNWLLANVKSSTPKEEFQLLVEEGKLSDGEAELCSRHSVAFLLLAMSATSDGNLRLARRLLQQCVELGKKGSLSKTLARKHLLNIHTNKKDSEAIGLLVKDAEEDGDVSFLEYFKDMS